MSGRLRFVLPLALGALAPALALGLSSSSCSLAGLASGGAGPTSSSTSTSSSGGAASTSGTGGGASSGSGTGGSAPMTCPDEMVQVDVTQEDGAVAKFCIDRLEVTNDDYLHFLRHAGPTSSNDPLCGWNATLEPAVHPDASPPKFPVLGVDWCDARAYCKSRGKRLCGSAAGGALPPAQLDRSNDQWFAACSNNNNAAYPYGLPDASLEACRDCDPDAGCDETATLGPDAAAVVGSIGSCEGGVPGLYDMSGNAWEWQDYCDDSGVDAGMRAPEYDRCLRRGGGYDVPHVGDGGNIHDDCLGCKSCSAGYKSRKNRGTDTGLRCCLDLSP